jgi:hypothetical protein
LAVAVNGLVAFEQPGLVRSLEARGVEIVVSGWSASRMITGAMPVDEERQLLEQAADAVSQSIGHRPRGYASQDYGYSANTPEVLEDLGFDYAIDWPNDEVPFAFGPRRKLVMVPAAGELDDAQVMLVRKLQPREWGSALDAALDWWESRPITGSVFALPLHAWVAGAAHRAPALRQALARHAPERFWQANPSDIVAWWREPGPQT